MKKNISTLTAISFAAVLALAACGGGGGGGDSSGSSSASSPTGASAPSAVTNLTTPQYATGSFQLAAFNLLNQQRQQCGFSAVADNASLDTAAQAHAQYQATNNVFSDTEIASNAGFTGVTYDDRAVAAGYPRNLSASGVSGGYYTTATLTPSQYGQQLVYDWLSGVYHIAIGVWPITAVGIGEVSTTFNGFPAIWSSLNMGNLQGKTSGTPLTFPCQGTTGVAYSAGGESPTPPNTSGNWGTPVAVVGNLADTIVLQSGTMTDTSGHVIVLQLLDSANDPNKILPAFEGVAYPSAPLTPNTVYAVSVSGTVNGTAFSRNFTFTTGNIVG
ncbi:CAP domain-containing protein [Paraburkholderia sp. EG304]|uniref:CAP domain-containing protein n=1 Tax=Paraburkholderia sp. EG304 TaxID=3237015 RepID=UPI00397E19F8